MGPSKGHCPRRSPHSSSMSNHIEVTLLEPCSRCSSVIIFKTTTSIMHRANSITNIAKFDPWCWNWKAPGSGPGGGQAATYVAKVDTPEYAIITPSSISPIVPHSRYPPRVRPVATLRPVLACCQLPNRGRCGRPRSLRRCTVVTSRL